MKKVVMIMLSVLMMTSIGAYAEEDRGEFYPLLTIVVDIDEWEDDVSVITCQDKSGNIWCFFDEEQEWTIGDIANLLMWNMGGPIEEDEIVEVYWTGHTENIGKFYQLIEWE